MPTPLIGTKVWFGPRRLGWGWTPVSREGWVTTIVAVAAMWACERHHRRTLSRVAAVALVAVCVLKGTPPGGPARAAEFHAQQRPDEA
jgi:hypothetical protein